MAHAFSMKPDEALRKLINGNSRFVRGEVHHGSGIDKARLTALCAGQSPYATVLTCSDSRVPPEIIFDAGLGDIFICRNAGNVVDEVTLGSIEYAAAHTGCPLLVVMGHEKCGACGATIAHYRNPTHHETHNVDDIVRRVMPAVIATPPNDDPLAFSRAVELTNVKQVCRDVMERSPLLKGIVESGQYQVVGAYYQLATGTVDILS